MLDFQEWLTTPTGRYAAAWECSQYDTIVADVFGFNALQIGVPQIAGLRTSRMAARWVAGCGALGAGPESPEGPRVALLTDCTALPFAEASLDLVILPHTLELSGDAHATLREVERVLVPEGKLVITGFNPWGWWAWRQRRVALTRRWGWGTQTKPALASWIGPRRLRDWLKLLGFAVEDSQFGCYSPLLGRQGWLDGWAWAERRGPGWWPFMGSVYCVVAVKRVRGMRLLGPAWKRAPKKAGAPVSVAHQLRPTERQARETTPP